MKSQEQDILYNVRELLEPLLAGKGLELYYVEFKGSGRRGVLRVFIDKTEGVTVDDCALVSRELGTLLDVHDVIPGSYTLEVSSPGLTRALRNPGDFAKFVGKKVKIKTTADIDRRKVFTGTLAGFDGELVTIDSEDPGGARYEIPYGLIEKANLELDF